MKIGSIELIGKVKERYVEIFRPDRRWNVWRGFYNGWIEGRTDLLITIEEDLKPRIDAKVKEREDEIRQWLIDEDFEGLAERL